MEAKYQITADNNVVINAYSDESKCFDSRMRKAVVAANRLRELHEMGWVKVTCNGGEETTADHSFEVARGPLVLDLPGFCELGSVRLISSKAEELLEELENIFEIEKKRLSLQKISSKTATNDMKDFAILLEHVGSQRDTLVTEDNKILSKAGELVALGVKVYSTVQTLDFLEKQPDFPSLN
ncbi:MAG: hypothetical protein OXP68_12425 [Anaerolineaceae bacterium]|nr:hypothetical protein [Anaerolineaceae bacterium]MDE0329072.1 hypothetical protein [Anaerolineaceae bacterium]